MNTILAIDDNRDNLITISALLKNFLGECRILTALSGAEGIEAAKKELPDTIILDVKMPGMDGFEVCRILKENESTAHIPVILLTAIRTEVASRIHGLEIGADAFLTKPIDEAELIAQIKVMLRIKHAEDLLRREKDQLAETVEEKTVALDETTRNLSRERDFIRAIEDVSPAYYVAINGEGKVLGMNRSMLIALDYKREDVTGRSFSKEFAGENARKTIDETVTTHASGQRRSFMECEILDAGGDEHIVEWHGRSVYDDEDKLDFIFFVGLDITERKRLEKIIVSASERERTEIGQKLHDVLGQNLAGAAFKGEILRLRLAGIDEALENEMTEVLSMVKDSISRTRDLARDLSPVDISAGGIVMAMEALRRKIEEARGVNVLLDMDEDLAVSDELVASHLYYIAREAVDNAAEHSGAGNIIISIRDRSEGLTLKVIDDGKGIPDDYDRDGMGIRLMKYRAWIIGASFSISKNEGGGTVVASVLQEMAADVLPGPPEGANERYLPGDGEREEGVLIVDDHPIVREGLSQIIERQDDLHVCGAARSSEEAIRLIVREKPSLVIMDISLEGASGMELIRAIKSRFVGLPVLVLSIYDETIYAERALRAGALGYIMKQEDASTVVEAIRTVLSGEQYISEKLRADLLRRLSHGEETRGACTVDCLTLRELEVFQHIGHGLSNKKIAEKLKISVKTVENYRDRIKNKMNFPRSSDLNHFAVQWIINNEGK